MLKIALIATLISTYDADTFKVNIPNVHPLFGQNLGIRIKGIDAPEKRTKDKCEKEASGKATEIVRSILEAGPLELSNCTRGKYFRLVCDVSVNGVNPAAKLIEMGLAYEYDGGTKTKVDWCQVLAK